jgi:hypothetical protein
MSRDCASGVLIGHEFDHLRLTRLGEPQEWGVAVLIDAMSGTLSGAWRDDTLVGIDAFCNELAQLYEALIGEAKLYSHDKSRMTMTAFPRGGVAVEVYVTDHDSMSLTYSFNLDQTHLPTIIRELREAFPEC